MDVMDVYFAEDCGRITSACCPGQHYRIISIFDASADELTKCPQFSEQAFYYNHNHGSVGALLKSSLEKDR